MQQAVKPLGVPSRTSVVSRAGYFSVLPVFQRFPSDYFRYFQFPHFPVKNNLEGIPSAG